MALRLFALCLGIALIWPAAPAAAQTFQIEVGGVTYELTATLGSYADFEATVGAATAQSQPWYDGSVPIASADNTLATTWGDAFQTAYTLDSQGFDPAIWYAFAFTTDGTNARADFYRPLGDVRHNEDTFGVGSDVFAVTTDFGGGFPWSFVSAEVVPAVPEIDGNALAKALFILFALGAWLHTRRTS
jgi:hypothetical protein